MNVSQWNLTRDNSPVSGLRRYDNEIFKECSKYVNVTRCRSKQNKIKTLAGMKRGDVTHITTHQLGFLNTLKHVKNCAVTVHDLTQIHWYKRINKMLEFWYLNDLFLKRADMFLTDSDYTKTDLLENYKIDEEKVRTVYLGVNHDVFRPLSRETCRDVLHMDQEATYLLSVSSGVPWKNTEILKKLPFNIIDMGYGRGQFGIVTDNTLAMLYSACDAFLMPSKAEGFCLPAVEAMACGCPVIASDITALPEVVGCGGALVDPDDTSEWSQAIDTVLSSREWYSKRAIRQATRFSWDQTGKETVSVYEEMIE